MERRWEKALASARTSIALFDEFSHSWLAAAGLLAQLGRLPEARAAVDKARELEPTLALANLSAVLGIMGYERVKNEFIPLLKKAGLD